MSDSAADTLRFFLDENLPVAIASQLRRHQIDVATARDMDALGDSDISHLLRAAQLGMVVCTYDSDFLEMAAHGQEHSGIIFGQQHKHGIGDWVRFLILAHTIYAPEDMINHVEFV